MQLVSSLPVSLRRAPATLACACALALAFAAAPAVAQAATADQLPLAIDASVPDDATLISSEYAQLPSGEVVSVADGAATDDPDLLGTPDAPPDPLEATGGERFVPMSVGEARDALAEGGVELLAERIGGNEYGAYWGTYAGTPAFYMKDGTLFACQAEGVIDVSEWNGDIDWAAVKAAGVKGAIIRIGFGTDRLDYKAARNISECKRLGIPFGIYIYSYAYDEAFARGEGKQVVAWMRELGVSPGDLGLPVYYDLERWSWTGHTPPTDPAVYTAIVRAWLSEVQGAGYETGVYSYTSYLYGPLNSDYIHDNVSWAAQYGAQLTFTDFGGNYRGWQYTSSGEVAGIEGRVDLNAFGNARMTYAVTASGAEGGSVSVSASPVVAGQTVTITVSPSAGKKLDVLTVTDSSGAAVRVTTVREGSTYTFTMPARAVSVSATFVCDGGALCPSRRFPDVDQAKWYHLAVDWAVENGAMNGYDSGLFGPEDTLTRAQIAGVLYNLTGQPWSDVSILPADCSRNAWYSKCVAWALRTGVMNGYGDGSSFGPNDALTREQAAAVLYNLAGKPSTRADLSSYPDADEVSSWAYDALSWAVAEGVINGVDKGGTLVLDPQATCSRAMLAGLMSNQAGA